MVFKKVFSFKNNKIIFTVLRNYTQSSELTKVDIKNGIKTITMCNEKTRNALSIPMMENLIENITNGENDKNLRVIVLAAEGKIFSAGHNLKEMTEESGKTQHEKVFQTASKLMCSIIDSPVPVIAKVDGLATAAGCQLIAQCDMAVCSGNSHFSTPGANVGIFCSTPGVALARNVPKMTAMYMLCTGLPLTGQEAKECGLVTKVCKTEDLDSELKKICDAIFSKSRSVIELGKRFFYQQIKHDVKKAYELGGETMVKNLHMKDGKEGIKSFVEKRKPNWSHE